MKKQITFILPFIILSSFSYAKDITIVKNASQDPIKVIFRSITCLEGICYSENVQPNETVNYEWKWDQIRRFITVFDAKGNVYSSTTQVVKKRRKTRLPVVFPNDFQKVESIKRKE